MKNIKCGYCKEEIKENSKKCQYCKKEFKIFKEKKKVILDTKKIWWKIFQATLYGAITLLFVGMLKRFWMYFNYGFPPSPVINIVLSSLPWLFIGAVLGFLVGLLIYRRNALIMGLLIGLIIALPFFGILKVVDSQICPHRQVSERGQYYHKLGEPDVKMCEKWSAEELQMADKFCEENTLYYLDKREPCLTNIFFFPFFPWSEKLGDAGIVLIYLIPLYGAIAGAVLGFIFASLTRKYETKKAFYKRAGFYLLIMILIWMIISLTQPVRTSESFNKPVYKELICRLQGCKYQELEWCANEDILYPYPKNQVNYRFHYPKVSIDKLPDEMIYCCDCFNPDDKEYTKKDLVNGTFCEYSSGYSGASIHNKYGGYYVKDSLIYNEGKICGPVGKIRYEVNCKC